MRANRDHRELVWLKRGGHRSERHQLRWVARQGPTLQAPGGREAVRALPRGHQFYEGPSGCLAEGLEDLSGSQVGP